MLKRVMSAPHDHVSIAAQVQLKYKRARQQKARKKSRLPPLFKMM
jgi:hypothetical protein